jgi:hypothetical protein
MRFAMNAFLPAAAFGELLVPEADEQVRAEAHPLPADEEQRQVVGEDEDEHREDEQVQVREEPREARVLRHVRRRVEVDEEADAGDDEHHHAAQRVDAEAHSMGTGRRSRGRRSCASTPRRPRELHVLVLLARRAARAANVATEAPKLTPTADERHHRTAGLPRPLAPDAVHERAEQRHAEDDGDERVVVGGEELRIRAWVSGVRRSVLQEVRFVGADGARRRKSESTMASPTATSAASAAMMKKAKICPVWLCPGRPATGRRAGARG